MASFHKYEEIVSRMPGVVTAHVYDQGPERTRVHVVARSTATPRQLVRQIVSLLRNFGWKEIEPAMVTVVQMQESEDAGAGRYRLRIVGYALVRSALGLEGRCRLGWGGLQFEGKVHGPAPLTVMAEATIAAVNQAVGGPWVVALDAKLVEQADRSVALVMVRYGSEEVLTGSAVMHGVLEETVVRATLDAVNRRVMLYSGAPPTQSNHPKASAAPQLTANHRRRL